MAAVSPLIPPSLQPRESYLKAIKPFIDRPIIKVLTGLRRVGKSYLLLQIINEIRSRNADANILYLNFEDLDNLPLTNAPALHEYLKNLISQDRPNYILLDEVQEVADFERCVRSLLLLPNVDIYITGSNADMLSGELATHLSGRYIEIPVWSLSYQEFLSFQGLEASTKSLSLYLRYGGLPYLRNLKLSDEVVWEYLRSIYSTVIYRDVIMRKKVRNSVFLERLLQYLADNVGSLFSAKKISDYLKSQNTSINVPQVQAYLSHLCDARLLSCAKRYDIHGKRWFEIGEKYYFTDIGLRNVIVGYRPGDEGKLLENAVYNHLVAQGYQVAIGALGTQEIDFVATRRQETLYVQACLDIHSAGTIEREYGNLLLIPDNYRKIVVTLGDMIAPQSYQGIETLSLASFLTAM
ncbi:MAG: ATP-binding protein [Bacteroidales bacterium]|nr:ATP-binding protein [Bacteroidales bacterium]